MNVMATLRKHPAVAAAVGGVILGIAIAPTTETVVETVEVPQIETVVEEVEVPTPVLPEACDAAIYDAGTALALGDRAVELFWEAMNAISQGDVEAAREIGEDLAGVEDALAMERADHENNIDVCQLAKGALAEAEAATE